MVKQIRLMFIVTLVFFTAGCQSFSPANQSTPIIVPSPSAIIYSPDISVQQTMKSVNLAQRIAAGCTAKSPRPTPGPTEQSLFPLPGKTDWQLGKEQAAVTIISYCDFQAQPCAQLAVVMKQLIAEFPEQVRWIYRYYPLTKINDKATLAVQAAEAAGKQGLFWSIFDVLYGKQSDWIHLSPTEFQKWVSEQVTKLGANTAQFQQAFQSQEAIDIAERAWQHNSSIGMPGVPFILLDGKIWPADLPLTYYTLKDYISLELLEKRQFESCPPVVIDETKSYQATIQTEKGNILLQLYPSEAPITVNNFVFLAQQGWYDGITFHRVIKDYIAQSGDPSGSGYGGPGYTFINEITPNLKFDKPGRVAMANSGKDTNGSQFFITYAEAPQLNGGYTIFGQVMDGMSVLQKLTPRNPTDYPPPPPGDRIITITITEQ